MKPEKVAIKGPQGYDSGSHSTFTVPEPQERYEEEGSRDAVTDIPSLEPFDLKAKEEDHTPNFTHEPKQPKMNDWTFHKGRGNGGIGL